MRWPRTMLILSFASSMLTACASSPKLVPAPPIVLPAEYATRCPPPVAPTDNSMDAAAVALKGMYDQYGVCAGRLVDLVNWIQKQGKTQ